MSAESGQRVMWAWLSAPLRVPGLGNALDEVPPHLVALFSQAAAGSGLLREQGGLFHYLDLYALSLGCYQWCSRDGTHLDPTANSVAAQQAMHLFPHDEQQQRRRRRRH